MSGGYQYNFTTQSQFEQLKQKYQDLVDQNYTLKRTIQQLIKSNNQLSQTLQFFNKSEWANLLREKNLQKGGKNVTNHDECEKMIEGLQDQVEYFKNSIGNQNNQQDQAAIVVTLQELIQSFKTTQKYYEGQIQICSEQIQVMKNQWQNKIFKIESNYFQKTRVLEQLIKQLRKKQQIINLIQKKANEEVRHHRKIIKINNEIDTSSERKVRGDEHDDQARILGSMIICVPLGYLIPKIPSPLGRQLYSFILGTIIQFFIYGKDILLVFALHALVYSMVRFNPKNCGKLVTIVTLVLLSTYHIYRMIVDYGYCQFLPCSPISTAFPYKYYEDYMQLRQQYANIPSVWKTVLHDFGYSLLMALVYILNILVFPLDFMKDPTYPDKSFGLIMFYSFFCVTTLRFKYYFGWKLSMCAIHASGVSYQQHQDGKKDFQLIQTCNPYTVQTTIHVRQKIANWNMSCQEWLRKCVYDRSHFKNKFYGQLLTFMVSAFWHGFYGGYYLSFLLWFYQVFISQSVFKQCKKQNSKWVKLYKSLGIFGQIGLWLLSNLTFTVCGTFFQVLSLKQGWLIIKSIYFYPIIIYFSTYIIFTYFGTKTRKSKGTNQEQQKLVNKQQNKSKNHLESVKTL